MNIRRKSRTIIFDNSKNIRVINRGGGVKRLTMFFFYLAGILAFNLSSRMKCLSLDWGMRVTDYGIECTTTRASIDFFNLLANMTISCLVTFLL